jgi:predicted Zn-ribbon and HTH transcriptional regulator
MFLAASVLAVGARGTTQTERACQKCGYDLTGNVSGRCPECGEAVKLKGDDS